MPLLARGLSTKEIATEMCISRHPLTTTSKRSSPRAGRPAAVNSSPDCSPTTSSNITTQRPRTAERRTQRPPTPDDANDPQGSSAHRLIAGQPHMHRLRDAPTAPPPTSPSHAHQSPPSPPDNAAPSHSTPSCSGVSPINRNSRHPSTDHASPISRSPNERHLPKQHAELVCLCWCAPRDSNPEPMD